MCTKTMQQYKKQHSFCNYRAKCLRRSNIDLYRYSKIWINIPSRSGTCLNPPLIPEESSSHQSPCIPCRNCAHSSSVMICVSMLTILFRMLVPPAPPMCNPSPCSAAGTSYLRPAAAIVAIRTRGMGNP